MSKEAGHAANKGGGTTEAEDAEEFTEEDAEAAFAEGLGETAPETPEGITGKETAPEGSEITDDASHPGAAGTETPGDETKDGDELSKKPSYEDLEKQLRNTQTWAHGLTSTVAELKKKVDATDPPGTKTGGLDQSDDDMPEEIKSYLEDYPEAKKAFEHLAKKMMGGLNPEEIQKVVTGMQEQLGQANFEKAVVTGFMADGGQWKDGQPDAYKIMATKDYQDWFTAELVRDPTLNNISDPGAAIDVLTRYKTKKAGTAAATHDADLGGDIAKDVKDIAAGGIKPGASTGPEARAKKDEDKSPDEIFDEHAT